MRRVAKCISLPHAGIVLLVGASGSGKSTLLAKLVAAGTLRLSEIAGSDQYRVAVADVEHIGMEGLGRQQAQSARERYRRVTDEAFAVMGEIVRARAALDRLTVIDATNLWPEDRARFARIARDHHVPTMAIALDVPLATLLARDAARAYPRGKQRVRQQSEQFRRHLRSLKTESFAAVHVLSERDLNECEFVRLGNPLVHEVSDGLDFIGDVHGCMDEWIELLTRLGYAPDESGVYRHPQGRRFVSVGDVMSRGPQSLPAMRFAVDHVEADAAYMIDSNHGWKIARWLDGRNVTLTHGDEKVAEEFAQYERTHGQEETERLRARLRNFLLTAPSHLVFTRDGWPQVVAVHAGIRDAYIGRNSDQIRDFCRYGDVEGMDEGGRPIRRDWFREHASPEWIVWGHDPRQEPLVIERTVNIDQGVVFGGALTAFRFPERELVSVKAHRDYVGATESPLSRGHIERFRPPDVGRFVDGFQVETSIHRGVVKIRPEHARAALEIVSRFAAPLEEMVYVPPTMSPSPESSALPGWLEHPREAFRYYREQGVTTLVVEEKHMGSRAVLLLFADEEAGRRHVGRATLGTIQTRTGRPFFARELRDQVLARLHRDLTQAGYFVRHETDLVLLDAEIMPWNLKARDLIERQYAHVAAMAQLDREHRLTDLRRAHAAGLAVDRWMTEAEAQLDSTHAFSKVFQAYCWNTEGIQGIQIAPFHTLALTGATCFDRPHVWHMEQGRELAEASDLFVGTEYRIVTDEASEESAIRWWMELTADGHEGCVVKPDVFVPRGSKGGLLQPAIKVRGREYLRIIYGMDYLEPENLARLRQRSVTRKQRHALMEFALGVESVERFVRGEPLELMHECVLASLALEAESVDPRL